MKVQILTKITNDDGTDFCSNDLNYSGMGMVDVLLIERETVAMMGNLVKAGQAKFDAAVGATTVDAAPTGV
ncbi:MAG: hypothetical protein ACRYGK_04400 [Janthinobacterium lividum]